MQKKTFEIKQIRGTILAMLREYFPNGLSGKSIFQHIVQPMFPDTDWDFVIGHLLYLRDRKFIEVVESQINQPDSTKEWVFRLTPAGLDLANGIVTDPAILVEV